MQRQRQRRNTNISQSNDKGLLNNTLVVGIEVIFCKGANLNYPSVIPCVSGSFFAVCISDLQLTFCWLRTKPNCFLFALVLPSFYSEERTFRPQRNAVVPSADYSVLVPALGAAANADITQANKFSSERPVVLVEVEQKGTKLNVAGSLLVSPGFCTGNRTPMPTGRRRMQSHGEFATHTKLYYCIGK